MSATAHPEPRDLINLAREELGKKKSQRIIEHCKQCPECAEALLEAVRAEAPGDRPPLTRWQWLSIALFVVALIAVVVAMVWFVRSAASPPVGLPEGGVGQRGSLHPPPSRPHEILRISL